MFKLLFWLGLIGGGVFVGGEGLPGYYNNIKIESVFASVSQNMASSPKKDVKNKINDLFRVQGVDVQALPDEFFENLRVAKKNGKLVVSSEYHIVLWLLGMPQSVDPEEDYLESDVAPMDKLRLRARMDFDFAPTGETP